MKKSNGSTKKFKPDVAGTPRKSKRKKNKKAPKFRLNNREQESLEKLLARLGITDWDFILVGDGSGSNWNREAGWSAVSIERITGERLVWNGCTNRGTVNFAEMMAYLQPLNWLAAREEDKRHKGRVRRQTHRVHIITDSDYCRQTGNSADRMSAKNGALWAVFDVFTEMGFILNWHWIPRESCGLNRYCDHLSKVARLLLRKYNLQERIEAREQSDGPKTVYDVNPSEVE